ncbi:MAG: methyl-accepting chemotaxis protein [Pseudomonadota bacterium]
MKLASATSNQTTAASGRHSVARALTIFLWIHVPLVAGIGVLTGSAITFPLIASAALAGLGTLSLTLPGAFREMTLASALIAQPAIMVGLLAGHAWQVDMHMYFFAMMAVLSLLNSIPALLAATVLVAVHHLSLNFALPVLVYPGGTDLGRTIVHAVVLVVETAGLSWMVFLRQRHEARIAAATSEREETLALAEQARRSQEQDANRISMIFDGASDAIRTVDENSEKLRGLTEQIADGARQQAASVQSASAAVEEMAANLRQSAENASTTEKASAEAASRAEHAGSTVNEAVTAMQTIAEKIGVVQEIARQTDLLALNAAVEAARAGEHGKGFAVVASEVRKLAERSQNAAHEISELSSQTQTVSGEAGRILSELVPEIQNTAELIANISIATQEQSIGITQIETSITDLDGVISMYDKLTSDAAEAANALADRADQLSNALDGQTRSQPEQVAGPDVHAA